MSGPSRDRQLYDAGTGVDWDRRKVNQLRSLANRVEDGLMIEDGFNADETQIAELLRAKADKIEAALRTLNNQTHGDFNYLVKTIQYNYSGDWGGEKVQTAWEDYGEKE